MITNTANLSRTLYFGLPVEVVHSMETCSVIRFSGHEVIVDACDLIAEPGIQVGPMEHCCSDEFYPDPARLPYVRIATIRLAQDSKQFLDAL